MPPAPPIEMAKEDPGGRIDERLGRLTIERHPIVPEGSSRLGAKPQPAERDRWVHLNEQRIAVPTMDIVVIPMTASSLGDRLSEPVDRERCVINVKAQCGFWTVRLVTPPVTPKGA